MSHCLVLFCPSKALAQAKLSPSQAQAKHQGSAWDFGKSEPPKPSPSPGFQAKLSLAHHYTWDRPEERHEVQTQFFETCSISMHERWYCKDIEVTLWVQDRKNILILFHSQLSYIVWHHFLIGSVLLRLGWPQRHCNRFPKSRAFHFWHGLSLCGLYIYILEFPQGKDTM
jgi:hypothetical protein